MGSLSKLAPECAICSRRERCNHKRMVAEAYIEQPLMKSGAVGAAQPVMRDGASEEIAKALREALSVNGFMNYGA